MGRKINFYSKTEVEDLKKIIVAETSEEWNNLINAHIDKYPTRNYNRIQSKLNAMGLSPKALGRKFARKHHVKRHKISALPMQLGIPETRVKAKVMVTTNEVRFPYKKITIDPSTNELVVTI